MGKPAGSFRAITQSDVVIIPRPNSSSSQATVILSDKVDGKKFAKVVWKENRKFFMKVVPVENIRLAESQTRVAAHARSIQWAQLPADNPLDYNEFRTSFDNGKFEGNSKFISYKIGDGNQRFFGEIISLGADGKSIIIKD